MVSICSDIFRNFLHKAREKYGDKYDYSLVEYKNSHVKVKIICPEHGIFEQTPSGHLKSVYGCKLCSEEAQRLSKKDFIRRATEAHNGKYNYSKVDYVSANNKITIICPIHGEFKQKPFDHMGGHGCLKCSRDNLKIKEFANKSSEIHGNKYDYSKVEYVNSQTKVTIICPKHGEFEQTPINHLLGSKCPKCARGSLTVKQFINTSNKIHNSRYDYSLIESICNTKKVPIICPIHGRFEQRVYKHLRGGICPECANLNKTMSQDEFICLAKNINNNNKYDYSKVNYVNSYTKVVIVCPEHGEFKQRPSHHLSYKSGCPSCPVIVSSGHQEVINFIKSITAENIIINDRSVIRPGELDIYLPNNNLGIEYHGTYWHSYDSKESADEIIKHSVKTDVCLLNNIKLIQIFENEWVNKQEVIQSRIKSILNIDMLIIDAKECIVNYVNNDKYKEFSKQYSLCYDSLYHEGFGSFLKLGLFFNSNLVAAMALKPGNNWEIIEFIKKPNMKIINGSKKLFEHFLANENPMQVIARADRRLFQGSTYINLGFTYYKTIKPKYYYTKSGNIYSKYSLDTNIEEDIFNNGYRRIWDAGFNLFRYL